MVVSGLGVPGRMQTSNTPLQVPRTFNEEPEKPKFFSRVHCPPFISLTRSILVITAGFLSESTSSLVNGAASVNFLHFSSKQKKEQKYKKGYA